MKGDLTTSQNTVYAVRTDVLTQIAPLRSATSHIPEPLSEIVNFGSMGKNIKGNCIP